MYRLYRKLTKIQNRAGLLIKIYSKFDFSYHFDMMGLLRLYNTIIFLSNFMSLGTFSIYMVKKLAFSNYKLSPGSFFGEMCICKCIRNGFLSEYLCIFIIPTSFGNSFISKPFIDNKNLLYYDLNRIKET